MAIAQSRWDHLIKPYKIAFETQKSEECFGTVVVEPLERGFGTTLGNALRRVLLSSIEGAAVTAVKIEGALLEFATIPGVREDVTDIILNLKTLALRIHGAGPYRATISVQGPIVVTAGMIQGNNIEVLDPDQVICTLSEGGALQMELEISRGKGYAPAAFSSQYNRRQIGEIMIDAQFNPVKRVSYAVESTRVGQSTDYDRLLLTVETNGAITPKDAISTAALILQDQLKRFVTLDPAALPADAEKIAYMDESQRRIPFPPALLKTVKELELSVRCLNCLYNEGIVYVGDLVKKKESDLLKTPNFGRKSLNEITQVLGQMGLSLGMEFPDWPPENMEKYLKDHPLDTETIA